MGTLEMKALLFRWMTSINCWLGVYFDLVFYVLKRSLFKIHTQVVLLPIRKAFCSKELLGGVASGLRC